MRALTRDPHTTAARALADVGVEVVQGDLNDRASLGRALKGAYGVHSVQAYMPHDPTGEVFQGENLAEAAKDAGVEHFVYSSAAGADQHVGAPESDSKQEGKVLLCKHPFSKTSRNPLLNGCNPGAYGYTPRISVASATRATANRYEPMRRFVSCSSAFTREAR